MFKKIFLFMLLVWPFEMIVAQRISSMEVSEVLYNSSSGQDLSHYLMVKVVSNSVKDIDYLTIRIGTSDGSADLFQSVVSVVYQEGSYYTMTNNLVLKIGMDNVVRAIIYDLPVSKSYGNYLSIQATYKNGKHSNVLSKKYKG
jgi:hypothetical protein